MSYVRVGDLGIEPSHAVHRTVSVKPFGPSPVPTQRIELCAECLSGAPYQPDIQSARLLRYTTPHMCASTATNLAKQEEEGRIERHGFLGHVPLSRRPPSPSGFIFHAGPGFRWTLFGSLPGPEDDARVELARRV